MVQPLPTDPGGPPSRPADGFKVELQVLETTSATFADASGNLMAALNTAAAGLGGLGAFWGNDDYGQKFGPQYQSTASLIFEALTKASEDMYAIAQSTVVAAGKYHVADDQDLAGASKVYPHHGGGHPA